jgi:mannose-6-phosphate isomerase-like protein (cupin superfamily)
MTITDLAQRAVAVQPGEGEAIWFLDNRMTIKATGEMTKGAYGLTEVLIPAGFSPPTHVHYREDESFFVLEGELTFKCGDDTFSAVPGSLVFLPRGIPHSLVVEGDTPARVLNLMTPGGGEGFFVEASRPATSDGFPPPSPPDIEVLKQASAHYGAAIVGPPLTPKAR